VELQVRARTDADLPACEGLVAAVHDQDGYPLYFPGRNARTLLTRPDPLAALVAVKGDEVVGHVALHAGHETPMAVLAALELQCEVDQLGVVARLFTATTHRREGIGRVLLNVCTNEAHARCLLPVLDVSLELRAAIALYESCGWTRLGTVNVELPDGRILPEYVYVA
jgi:GNAT superfamily N-acetyltransferase